jgi:hypothetical protein
MPLTTPGIGGCIIGTEFVRGERLRDVLEQGAAPLARKNKQQDVSRPGALSRQAALRTSKLSIPADLPNDPQRGTTAQTDPANCTVAVCSFRVFR